MPETIKASERPLNRIFCDDFLFQIPAYQRPYAWTAEEAGELLQDLIDASEGGRPVPEIPPYFLGSIVLIKKPETPEAAVVDGQQRLTTLTILFAALRATADENKPMRESADRMICQRGDIGAGTEDTFRLTARDRDAEFFRQYIQAEDPPAELDLLPDAQRNMVDNFRLFLSELRELELGRRLRLLQFAIQRCYLVVVETSDRSSAYRIFSVLNNRGLDLSATDILKADIIGGVSQSRQIAYTRKWEDIEEALGRDAFGDLFGHIRMIHRKAKMRGALDVEFREFVDPTSNPETFIDHVLAQCADAYEIVLRKSDHASSEGAKIRALMGSLALLDNSDWQPPAIHYLAKHRGDPSQIVRFLRGLDRLAFSMFICRADINERISRYAAVLHAIDRDEDAFAEGRLGLSIDEKHLTRSMLDGPVYENQRTRMPIVLRLDQKLSDGSAHYDLPIITIEHVMPQNPEPDSEWVKTFPDPNVRAAWVHRLGNLVLLSRRKNSAARNWDFETKKEKYFVSGGSTPFALTSQVMAESGWTVDTLERRQRGAMEALVELWDLAE